MAQTENKVEWCLEKARRELAEGGSHRGLVRTDHDKAKARKHLDKAQHNLNAALFFEKNGYSDWSASAFFYCIYHCFLSILAAQGYESRNQECSLAVIRMLRERKVISIDKKFIDALDIAKRQKADHSMIEVRERFQYGTDLSYADKRQFKEIQMMCQSVIAETSEIIL